MPPETAAEARRRLLDAASRCIEQLGPGRAGLTDVARVAGVTRQTVYRYFEDADDLFRSAAALASGGFLEQLRAHVGRESDPVDAIVECVVFTALRLPEDPQLGSIVGDEDVFSLAFLMDMGFVQEELVRLSADARRMEPEARDRLAELLLRLLYSLLADPARTDEDGLRARLRSWLRPVLREALGHP